MAQFEVILPRMGESIAEATIIKWLKKQGERVEEEDVIVEIATDKVDSELPSPATGILHKILIAEGEVAKVGQAIAIIEDEREEAGGGTDVPAKAQAPVSEITEERAIAPSAPPADAGNKTETGKTAIANARKFFSPLVRNMAKTEGISQEELHNIPGTGKEGRITKKDMLTYLENRHKEAAHSLTGRDELSSPVQTEDQTFGQIEVIEMDRMRKLIASHMIMSRQTSAHVTSFIEADVSAIVKWRERVRGAFEKKENEKITFTPIFIEACVKTIKDYPLVNVSVDGDRIIKKNYINIGMATALQSGNLIVPVIKNAELLNLRGLIKSVNDLASRARNNKLLPDEIQGGTFTLTNIGTFNNTMGTPIINQPQVAILATGAIRKRPVVIETEQGDLIGIRHMMHLSLSYDHRVVDGALGGMFLQRIAEYLERFDTSRPL